MIGQTRALRVWAWPAPVDLRKGFNGLAGLVYGQPGLELWRDHIPWQRQVRRMERAGLTITNQTLWDQSKAMADLLWPTYEAHHDDM